MFEIETTTGVTMLSQTIGVGPMFHLKIGKLLLGMVDVKWNELKRCCKR